MCFLQAFWKYVNNSKLFKKKQKEDVSGRHELEIPYANKVGTDLGDSRYNLTFIVAEKTPRELYSQDPMKLSLDDITQGEILPLQYPPAPQPPDALDV